MLMTLNERGRRREERGKARGEERKRRDWREKEREREGGLTVIFVMCNSLDIFFLVYWYLKLI